MLVSSVHMLAESGGNEDKPLETDAGNGASKHQIESRKIDLCMYTEIKTTHTHTHTHTHAHTPGAD